MEERVNNGGLNLRVSNYSKDREYTGRGQLGERGLKWEG